jgi:hypothetical protein
MIKGRNDQTKVWKAEITAIEFETDGERIRNQSERTGIASVLMGFGRSTRGGIIEVGGIVTILCNEWNRAQFL